VTDINITTPMSLGTSIFLSSLVLAFVALFIATKDRWNWKKIILWPLAGLILIASALWIYSMIEQRPKVEHAFWDIPLDATKSDVRFIKGEPSEKDDNMWRYFTRHENGNWATAYYVHFHEDKVWCITFYANDRSWETNIQSINIGHGIDEVRRKFGEPSHISISDDELKRLYTFSRYNVVFELEKNKVTALGIAKRAPHFASGGKNDRRITGKGK
jgi:4-amino-4-deoxy-L-arabinose transferase-like glycosyltransferase